MIQISNCESRLSSSPSEKDMSEEWAGVPSDQQLKRMLHMSQECLDGMAQLGHALSPSRE